MAADTTITATKIELAFDRFPGLLLNLFGPPMDMSPGGLALSIGSCGQNSPSPTMYQAGEKIRIRNRGVLNGGVGVPGWSELTYLLFDPSSASAAACGDVCVPASLVAQQNSGAAPLIPTPNTVARLVANVLSTDTDLSGGKVAVALTAMTAGYYGWFWTGGVCPADAGASGAALAAATLRCYDDVAVGKPLCVKAGATATTLLHFYNANASYLAPPVGSVLLL
jgi:hypothetical protein